MVCQPLKTVVCDSVHVFGPSQPQSQPRSFCGHWSALQLQAECQALPVLVHGQVISGQTQTCYLLSITSDLVKVDISPWKALHDTFLI